MLVCKECVGDDVAVRTSEAGSACCQWNANL